jgi:glycogen(starch) synthase
MKVLLVGPLPPPNGGISVHVMQTQRRLTAAGAQCSVLDPSRTRGKFVLVGKLMRYASQGWAIQPHTNGHNTKSWLMALICGTIARANRVPAALTLHSGMVPQYLAGSTVHRSLARLACSLYQHIVCVSPAIEAAIASLGVDRQTIEVRPAFTPPEDIAVSLDQPLIDWMENHSPLLSTTLFFRPEYGFPLLVEAIARLRRQYPRIGCVVMGSCEHGGDAFERIREASIEDNMLLLGDVEHDRCLSIMSASDLFVRPTLHDGDSISVREALALDVAVLASRTGNRPEGVHLFQPGDVDDLVAQATRVLPAATRERRVCA